LASKPRRQLAAYVGVVAGCFAIGMLASYTLPAQRADFGAYDWMLYRRAADPWTPQSVVVAIDEQSLSNGGQRAIRTILADAPEKIAQAEPKAVAIDVILHDNTSDEIENARLDAAIRANKNVILDCETVISGTSKTWEDPLPRFRPAGVELGHVDLPVSNADGVNRQIPLREFAGGEPRWALSLKTFGVAHSDPIPVEDGDKLRIGGVEISAPETNGRMMRIRYLQESVPTVSATQIDQHRDMIRGKTVFLGVTALSYARDRLMNPYGRSVPGVEVHAQAYETIARGRFISNLRDSAVAGICALFAIAAGLIFRLRSGWQAYVLGAVLVAIAAWMPLQFFAHDLVFPFIAPVAVATFATAGAAIFRYFGMQSELGRSESEKSRYQQAIHWAAHEMRTPLTAIQGSSEIMTRYSLPDAKRHELSEMINSESKRLARMIQTFLDVERLADGQMELKREPFPVSAVVETCLKRVEPIAERKKTQVFLDGAVEGTIVGDRELMEYALYNLLTNAVKYSPAETEVHVTAELHGGELRLAVRDQGIGMDAKELKSIFTKFYRTKRAEASGEVGTGIGLSIVEQIVSHHGGRMEVTSEPGKGSCFTMILTALINAETSDRRG
jgi:signal transduction histidine kinase